MIPNNQGSEEWLEWRKSKIGSSDVPIILGLSKYSTPFQLWKRKLGFDGEQTINPAMQRGKDLEAVVLEMVNFELGTNFEPEVVEHPVLYWASASLDGIDHANKLILEIKCPNKEDHILAMHGEIPEPYLYQMLWQMFVTGFTCGYYASYDGDDLSIVKLENDLKFNDSDEFKVIEEFYNNIKNKIPPKKTEKDVEHIDNEEFKRLSSEWRKIHHFLDHYKELEEYYRSKMIELAPAKVCEGYGVRLTQVKKSGSIDWKGFYKEAVKQFPDIEKLSPDTFKKPDSQYWKVIEVR